jgi:2-hydroxy-3-keto-5-methylthiopentenyl-1-phosphate phosphatase
MIELKIAKPSSAEASANGSPRQWHVILDFDGTITTDDTIDLLVQASISIKHPSLSNSKLRETDEAKSWEVCKKSYVQDLEEYFKGLGRSGAEPRGNLNQSFIKAKETFMDRLRPVELASIERVGRSGVFREVTPSQLRQRARELAMAEKTPMQHSNAVKDGKAGEEEKILIRKGFREFIKEIETHSLRNWGIISVNWSGEWIRGALDAALGGEKGGKKGELERVDMVPVMSNEINITTGAIEGYKLDIVSFPSCPLANINHISKAHDRIEAQKLRNSRLYSHVPTSWRTTTSYSQCRRCSPSSARPPPPSVLSQYI